MKVSVIIITFLLERLNCLLELLEGLEKQTYRDFEVITVVDENSKYYNVIREKISCNQKVKLFFNKTNKGLAYSRNLGVRYAKGDIVAFVDDDAIPYPNWVEEIVNTYKEDENIGGVAGEVIPSWENNSMMWFPKELWWIISCSYTPISTLKQEVRNGFGTNISFKKEIVEDIGFFNTNLGKKRYKWIANEETELCIRLKEKTGKKIILNPNAKVKHKIFSHRLEIKNITKRAYFEGYSKAFLNSMHKYNVLLTESEYLKQLLFQFYPKFLKGLAFKPFETFKQLLVATLVIIAVGSGYLGYKISSRVHLPTHVAQRVD